MLWPEGCLVLARSPGSPIAFSCQLVPDSLLCRRCCGGCRFDTYRDGSARVPPPLSMLQFDDLGQAVDEIRLMPRPPPSACTKSTQARGEIHDAHVTAGVLVEVALVGATLTSYVLVPLFLGPPLSLHPRPRPPLPGRYCRADN
jgi:hypothetical protein